MAVSAGGMSPARRCPCQSSPVRLDVRVQSGTVPRVSPEEAFGAVLFYPDDQQEIGELATQPFVADYLQDLLEQDRVLTLGWQAQGRVLITGFDSAIVTCIGHDRPRAYTVVYEHPAFAQRQAQMLWNLLAPCAAVGLVDAHDVRPQSGEAGGGAGYQLAYEWTPFAQYGDLSAIARRDAAPRWSVDHRSGSLHCETGIGREMGAACGLQLQAMMPVASLSRFACIKCLTARAIEAGDHAVPGGQDRWRPSSDLKT